MQNCYVSKFWLIDMSALNYTIQDIMPLNTFYITGPLCKESTRDW